MVERALYTDIDSLMGLMEQHHDELGLEFDREKAYGAMSKLLSTPQLGAVWVARNGAQYVGYLALCLGFSLERAGLVACIDEIYVEPSFRSHGWDWQLVEAALETGRASDLRSVHLHLDKKDRGYIQACRGLGFEANEATYLTCRLD